MTSEPTTAPAASPAPRGAFAPARRPSRAVLRAEARLFLREPGNFFWIAVFPPGLLTILGLIPTFREPSPDLGGLRLIETYVPVTVLVALIVAGVQALPPVITGYRERGILRRMSATPVRPSALLFAQMGLHGVAALVSALLSLAIGRLAYDVRLPEQIAGYLLALLLAAAASLAMGALVAAFSPTAKIATAVGSAVFLPMMFAAGVWLPVQAMPDALATVVGLLPFGAAAEALGRATGGSWPDWSSLGILALWAIALTGAATRWFRWQ
ncbi:ABC transporter permease [Streptomyces sp. NPDC002734]|uniref:ABC transporter permease n=1 Tax=Streptomyces sp. NPDC002734 TaxID=3154426 RepID=UPI003321DC01